MSGIQQEKSARAERLATWLRTARARLAPENYDLLRNELKTLHVNKDVVEFNSEEVLYRIKEIVGSASFPDEPNALRAWAEGFQESLPRDLKHRWAVAISTLQAGAAPSRPVVASNSIPLSHQPKAPMKIPRPLARASEKPAVGTEVAAVHTGDHTSSSSTIAVEVAVVPKQQAAVAEATAATDLVLEVSPAARQIPAIPVVPPGELPEVTASTLEAITSTQDILVLFFSPTCDSCLKLLNTPSQIEVLCSIQTVLQRSARLVKFNVNDTIPPGFEVSFVPSLFFARCRPLGGKKTLLDVDPSNLEAVKKAFDTLCSDAEFDPRPSVNPQTIEMDVEQIVPQTVAPELTSVVSLAGPSLHQEPTEVQTEAQAEALIERNVTEEAQAEALIKRDVTEEDPFGGLSSVTEHRPLDQQEPCIPLNSASATGVEESEVGVAEVSVVPPGPISSSPRKRRRVEEIAQVGSPSKQEALANMPKCVICKSIPTQPKVASLCGHFACSGCWDSWMVHRFECPMCRRKTRPNNLVLILGWDE